MTAVEDRFWSKIDASDGCWLWTGSLTHNGYGRFKVDGKMVRAHRFAYQMMIGDIPEGMELDHRHTCPKRCVNPEHLRLVTHKRNQENRSGAMRNSSTGIQGVYWDKRNSCWHARVGHHGKRVHVGRFLTSEEAEAAVVAKRLELFTHNDADRLVTV
ncbi:HNH endonuclease [Mycobacterium phage Cane17]|uniref:HNH endonuclease n=2 Tax=Bixzunavirus TaxID=680114 RepID=A0A346N8Q2_9CAUD|nr:HNH endonuclease [Mycobacterium phage Nappy]YP_010057258.1 HNH endonuclease [Mycobacterium phage Cane17]AER25916.1 HNH endonuclease [Mycobacterium phage Nappy]AXQ51687.1 HNH endonuclease [Mycobacterium phage Cane17]